MRASRLAVVIRPAPGARRRAMLCAAGAAVSVALLAGHASADNYVWTSVASTNPNNNMSVGSNWQGGIAPPSNDPATTLTFAPGLTNAGNSVNNNIGGGFMVNSFTFLNSNIACAVNETNAAPLTGWNFVANGGTLPTINLNGTGQASMNPGVPRPTLSANLTIGGTGYQHFTLAGLDEAVAGRSVTIAPIPAYLLGTPASMVLRTVQFNGSTTYTGGTTLDGGNIQIGGFSLGPTSIGSGGTFRVTNNGGTFLSNGGFGFAGASWSTLQLDGTLRMIGSVNIPLIGSSTASLPANPTTLLTGSGTLEMGTTGSGGLTVLSNSTGYTGSVILDRPALPQVIANVGAVTLASNATVGTASGALVNVPAWTLRAGGSLVLNNNANDSLQNGDRVGDSATITMSSGNISLTGPAAAGTSAFAPSNLNETVGAISSAGYSTLTANPGTANSVSTTLTGASLARSQRGTFLFRGLNLGAGMANSGNIQFTSSLAGDLVGGGGAAGSTTLSILPYAIGDATAAGNGASLVTYDANGVRPLALSEYATDLVSGATTNARLGAIAANNVAAPATVNALVISAAGPALANAVTVTGSQINLTSGVLLFSGTATGPNGGTASISNDINFGAAEGQVFATFTSPGAATSTLTLSGALLGSNGMTKSGNGTVLLTGNNSGLTGTLTMNAGVLNFNSGAALPGTGQIVVNGAGTGSASLTYSGAAPLAVSRDIAVNTGLVTLGSTTAGQALTLSGQISGVGGVLVATTGEVVLSGNNTYTGPTTVTSGVLRFSADANLGSGTAVGLAGGTLQADGDWTTSRMFNISAGSTLNVSGANTVTLNGPMTNSGINFGAPGGAALTKTGTGTLTINSTVTTFNGALNINGGKVLINSTVAASAFNAITVNTNGTLGGTGVIPRNIVVNSGGTLAPGNSAGILTVTGAVTLGSGSTFAVELNGPSAGNGPNNYDRLVSQGNYAVNLTGSNLAVSLGYIPSFSDVFWILTKDGINFNTGTFNGLPEGASVLLGYDGPAPIYARISYFGDFASNDPEAGLGNDIVLYAIPAPSGAALLGLSGILAVRRRRR